MIKIALSMLITLMIGIKLVAADIFPVSIYIEAPPITVGINVNKFILSEPSFTVFALNESILMIAAVKKANTPTTKKNNMI